MACAQYIEFPSLVGFLDLNYCYKSEVIQITHYADWHWSSIQDIEPGTAACEGANVFAPHQRTEHNITTSNKEMKHTLYIVQTGIYQNTNKTTKIKMDKRTVKDMYEKMVNDFETNCVNGRRFLREVKAQNDSAMISRINNQYFLREISHVES